MNVQQFIDDYARQYPNYKNGFFVLVYDENEKLIGARDQTGKTVKRCQKTAFENAHVFRVEWVSPRKMPIQADKGAFLRLHCKL